MKTKSNRKLTKNSKNRYRICKSEQDVAIRISNIKDTTTSLQHWKNEAYSHYVAYNIMKHPTLYIIIGSLLATVTGVITLQTSANLHRKASGGSPDVDTFLRTSTDPEHILRILHKYRRFYIGLKCIQYGDLMVRIGAIAAILAVFGITISKWRTISTGVLHKSNEVKETVTPYIESMKIWINRMLQRINNVNPSTAYGLTQEFIVGIVLVILQSQLDSPEAKAADYTLYDNIYTEIQQQNLKLVKNNKVCLIVGIPQGYREGDKPPYSIAKLIEKKSTNLWKFSVQSHGPKPLIPSNVHFFYATVNLNKNTIIWHKFLKQEE